MCLDDVAKAIWRAAVAQQASHLCPRGEGAEDEGEDKHCTKHVKNHPKNEVPQMGQSCLEEKKKAESCRVSYACELRIDNIRPLTLASKISQG